MLIDLYVANPQHFYVPEVLGLACMDIFGTEANPASLTGKQARNHSKLRE